MEAIEFVGKKAAKGLIKIPKAVEAQIHDEFRVIILQNMMPETKAAPKRRSLSAPTIKTKGFKFDRDEANAR